MSFFVSPNEDFLDNVTETVAKRPEFDDRYEAISELRDASRQGLTLGAEDSARANGFFRVASLQGPIETLAKCLDPDFLKDKNKFYRWLDRHPQHCVYDRRKLARPKQLTFSDGKAVL